MRKVKEPDYEEFRDDDVLDDDFAESDGEIGLEDEDISLADDAARVKRSWRDTERYMEMRELYRIINDELYTGIFTEDIFNNEDYDY